MLHKNTNSAEARAHMTLKAVTTATDEGLFEAVISTEGIDREKDIVSAAGMVAALKRWNRPIPLSWNHSTEAADIFGSVDSQTAREVNQEVAVDGQVDLGSKVGAEAWRSFKNRTVGFSFGYLILASTKRAGGGRNITDLDIFEITATPTPMNNETRVLSTKSVEEQRTEAEKLAREVEATALPDVPEAKRLASDISEMLDAAGATHFGRTETQWVYLDDYDPDAKWAVFCIASAGSACRYVQVPYALDGNGTLVLGDTETDVVRTTSYRAANGAKTFTTSELQEVKTELAETRAEVEALKKKADEAGKEHHARPVDPLRKQADALALELASGGQSLRKPPKTVTPEPPELIPLADLKRRMRDEMLGVLSGGITE